MQPYSTPAYTAPATPVERTALFHTLLVRGLYGGFGQAGGRCTVDGLPAPLATAFAGSILLKHSLIGMYRDDRGDLAAHLTMQGLDVLRAWDLAALEDGAP